MPFTYNLDPVIFSIGPISVRWYSLAYVIGFLLAYWLLMRIAEKGRIKGLDRDKAEELVIWLMVGLIAGARIAEALIYEPAYFAQQPWKIIAVWEGGMSFHGGLIGAAIATYWFSRKRKVSFYQLADLLVLPGTIAIFLGRVANFINGELVGRVTDVAWCVNYPGLAGCRHPSQFYEAFAEGLLLFAILLPIYLKGTMRGRLRDGTLFWIFVTLYGIARLVTNFWRAPEPGETPLLGLLIGQWLSIAMIALGAAVLGRRAYEASREKKAAKRASRK